MLAITEAQLHSGGNQTKRGPEPGTATAHRTARGLQNRQSGIAAVEFAVILPILIALLAFPLFFGRVFMHYSVAQRAAQSAALYLSTMSRSDLAIQSRFVGTAALAESIAREQIAELSPGLDSSVVVTVLCNGRGCGPETPLDIEVSVEMRMYDDYFNDFTWVAVGGNGILLTGHARMRYVGK